MNNPDCLWCGYPRRGDGQACSSCSGTFPCCQPGLKERDEMVRRIRDLQEGGEWIWLNDGSDDLESMGEDMVVKIRAGDLRRLTGELKSDRNYWQKTRDRECLEQFIPPDGVEIKLRKVKKLLAECLDCLDMLAGEDLDKDLVKRIKEELDD